MQSLKYRATCDTASDMEEDYSDDNGEEEYKVALFFVGKLLWEGVFGFELWELSNDGREGGYKDVQCLDMMAMERKVSGRKWVHENVLLDFRQSTAKCNNLMDKKGGSALPLGKSGERQFAPRVGSGGEMKSITPA